jgi:hypothetical protein
MMLLSRRAAVVLGTALVLIVALADRPAAGAVRTAGAALTFTLSTNTTEYAVGEPVEFLMVLRNESSTPRTLEFPTGQRFDVAVRAGQTEVWRWSADRAFVQVVGSLTLQPGEEQTFTATWEQPSDPGLQAPPGPYEATAELTATEPLSSNTAFFSVR